MINPFTVQTKIDSIQQDVLKPLYTMSSQQFGEYSWLLAETGRAVARHQSFIEELCSSRLVAAVFSIVKLLGGAEQMTQLDFDRFTSYVNDGGLGAMIKMLLSVDREKVFSFELSKLPENIQHNAPLMLAKAKALHGDFITAFFEQSYGTLHNTPEQLRTHLALSTEFIENLTVLAQKNLEVGV